MLEEWIKMSNDVIPRGRYEVTQVLKNFDGVLIELDNEINKLSIFFENTVLALRVCDEGDRLRTIDEVLSNKEDSFFIDWPFYIVKNSRFSQWMENESFGIRKQATFKHYSIVTPNDVIDILSVSEPQIKLSEI